MQSSKHANVHYEFGQSIFEQVHKFVPQINSTSRQLAQPTRTGPVHSRLYQLGMTVKRPPSSRSAVSPMSMPFSSAKQSAGTPSSSRTEQSESRRIEDQIVLNSIKRRSKLDRIRTELRTKQKSECNFTPVINPISEEIASQRPQIMPTYEALYNEARIREEKQQQRQLPIHEPQRTLDPDSEVQLVTRLLNSHKRTDLKLKQARSSQYLQDPKTGLALYSPDIRRSQASYSKLSSRGSYSQSEFKGPLEAPLPAPQEHTFNDTIYEMFRCKQIEALFAKLDQNFDGVVQASDFESLDDEALRRVLSPVEESCSLVGDIRKEEFVKFVQALCTTMNLIDRSTLLKRRSCSIGSPPLTSVSPMQPVLSPRSELLAAKKRANLPSNIYEREVFLLKVSPSQQKEDRLFALGLLTDR